MLAVLSAVAAPAAGATAFGLGDQDKRLFEDKRFTALTKLRIVRYIAPWDVQYVPERRAAAEQWIHAARAGGYLVHVTFNYGARSPLRNPSVASYVKATKAFVDRHREDVETWGVFNEVNRGLARGRFITPGPKLAAQLFTAFRTKVCVGCKVVGVDLLDGQTIVPTLRYLRTFKQNVKTQPKIWGFHNYSDTNRASMQRTSAFLANISPKAGQVWITETGGLYRLGSTFAPSTLRQSAATRQVFAIAKRYPRLSRVYLYNFFGPGPDRPDDIFDAGLVAGNGKARPAYSIVKTALR
ncbi:MAG: hypothetical protein Q7T55_06960 [Solirubrobacteraceae bacterium]|nr:hypothetical protein [Solirubrobacteraceae bacterium]